MTKTFAEVRADVLDGRMERIALVLEDLRGALAGRRWFQKEAGAPDIDQANTEADRIDNLINVRWLTGEEAMAAATQPGDVAFLGEDLEAALMLGHVAKATAARRALTAYADYVGADLDLTEGPTVHHGWVVFEDASDLDDDFGWWAHDVREGEPNAVAITRVNLF